MPRKWKMLGCNGVICKRISSKEVENRKKSQKACISVIPATRIVYNRVVNDVLIVRSNIGVSRR
jgi:hypothetical protein